MKKSNILLLSVSLYLVLAVIAVFASQWYVDKKDDKEWKEAVERLDSFFSKQKMFVNVDYSGKKVGYEKISIPKFEPSMYSLNYNKEKEEWNDRWSDVYKVYKLKPRYTSERSWDSDNEWTGWCFTIIEKDSWNGFSEYMVYPYQVAFKKQSSSWMYNYMPTVQEAVNESYDFHANNDKSSYKEFIVSGDKIDNYEVCEAVGEPWSKHYYVMYSYDYQCRILGKDKADSLLYAKASKKIAKREFGYRMIRDNETRYYGGMYNDMYKVNNLIQPTGHWDLNYNFTADPKTSDKRKFIIWSEAILAFLILSIVLIISIVDNKQKRLKSESLKEKLLRLCNPTHFMKPYDEMKVATANDLFEKIISTPADNIEGLKKLRKIAAKELGICFINPRDIKELIALANPERYTKPYNAEKVRVANQLYNRLTQDGIDVDELEDIQKEINDKLIDNK